MNYFELYDIPVSFNPDEAQVKRKFYELSKKYHPDFHVNEAEEKQQEILELSTLNNKAYQVLNNSGKRVEYILNLYGLIEEGEKYQLPQDFLMEMMEVNEALMELEFEPEPTAVNNLEVQVDAIEYSLDADLKELTKNFDQQSKSDKNESLKKIKDIWYRKKYLLRIRDSLNRFASLQ